MPLNASIGVSDHVEVEMVTCPVPEPEPGVTVAMVTVGPETTPTTESAEATIEQTGADPPPLEPR